MRWLGPLLLCGVLLFSTAARAQEMGGQTQDTDGRARAQALFEQGVSAAAAGDHQTALERFDESYRLFAHPGTLANLAIYQEGQGRLVDAYLSNRELLERFGGVISGEARDQARVRLARLAASLALVEVSSDPPGARVILDGEPLGTAPLDHPVPVEPGAHTLEARLAGHEAATIELDLAAGQREPVVLVLRPARGEAPEQPIEAPSGGEVDLTEVLDVTDEAGEAGGEDEPRGFWRGPWPWVIGGLVLAAGAASIVGVMWPDGPELNAEREFE